MMFRYEGKAISIRVKRFLEHQTTLRAEEIPELFHESGVLAGYRMPGQSMFTYFLSAFQLHNETVNIWTHFIGFVVVLLRTLFLLDEFGADDPRMAPVLGFSACCLLYTTLSVTAHIFHSASPSIHYTCFHADYAGIGIGAFGGALPVFYLSADNQTRTSFDFWFLPVNFILSWVCFFCCCIARLKHNSPHSRQRKLLQLIPLGLHTLMSVSFIYRRFATCYFEADICDDPGLGSHERSAFLALLAGLAFSSHIPEKIWPGYFDLIGHGHNVFHALCIILNLSQFNAARDDILHFNRDIIAKDDIPGLSCLLGMIFCLCACSALTMVALRPLVLRRIRIDDLREKRN